MAESMLCKMCGESCNSAKGCDLYADDDDPHLHCPGGLRTYGLCLPCDIECLKIHRPVAADGTWKWIKDCGNASCGYCQAAAKEMLW